MVRACIRADARLLSSFERAPTGGPFVLDRPAMLQVMTRRADFLAANRGLRNARPGFVLLTRPNEGQGMRYGITVTKKIGNAVVRNRMKRRFRELLRGALPQRGLADHDHVLIGRDGGIERDFHLLRDELERALARAREGKGDAGRGRRPPRGNRPVHNGVKREAQREAKSDERAR